MNIDDVVYQISYHGPQDINTLAERLCVTPGQLLRPYNLYVHGTKFSPTWSGLKYDESMLISSNNVVSFSNNFQYEEVFLPEEPNGNGNRLFGMIYVATILTACAVIFLSDYDEKMIPISNYIGNGSTVQYNMETYLS